MVKKTELNVSAIDAVLPQTQCGLCGFNGCMPYAEALAEREAPINLCPPGGVEGLRTLGQLLDVDPAPYLAEMTQKAKPSLKAVIDEATCIGCTKCIKACPVDAIAGSAKLMHTIIADECTGCELCIAPCPVDCIHLIPSSPPATHELRDQQRQHARERYLNRAARLAQKPAKKTQVKRSPAAGMASDKLAYLQAALARAKAKKIKP